MNEYRGGEMLMEVVVDRNLWMKLWTVDGSESVLQAWLHGRAFDFCVHKPNSRPVLTFFYLFFFFFFNLKLSIIPFCYFVIQFNIKTFGKKIMIYLMLLSIT